MSDQDKDPVVHSSLSKPLYISSVLLVLSMVWGLYDEMYGIRPWKAYQARFVKIYSRYLKTAAGGEADVERVTVFRLPPKIYATGSLALAYTFVDAGDYVGLVSVGEGDHKMVARFPFAVGSSNRLRNSIAWVVVAIGIAAAYGLWHLRRNRKVAA